jgi:PAS domain S-box-containing protein
VQRLRGFTAQEVMDQPGEASVTPESLGRVQQLLSVMLADPPPEIRAPGGSVRLELAQPCKDGSVVWTETAASPLFDQQGRPTEILGVSRNISDRKAAQDLLQASEERYRTLFATIVEGFALHEIICDDQGRPVDYRFLDINPAFERLTGLVREDLVGKTVLQALPGTEDYWIQTYGRVALTGEPVSFENYHQTLDRHYAVTAFCPRRGQFAAVFSDVTDARRIRDALQAAVAEKDLLLREIHHRVKNNLQVIASLLSLQLDGHTDPVIIQAMRDSQNRIRSMALIHTKLYESRDLSNVDFGGFVTDLTRILSHSFGAAARGVVFQVEAGTITLGVDTVIPCSLIINELVTNSMRHAFAPGHTGLIAISMQANGGEYVLRVTDDGPGLPSGLDIYEMRSLGLRLVTMLTEQLCGTVTLEPGPGACFVVRFPQRGPHTGTPPPEAP